MESLPVIKAKKSRLTERRRASVCDSLSHSKAFLHSQMIPGSKDKNSVSEAKLKKVHSNLFILPLPSKPTPTTSKMNYALSNYNLLRSRLLKHRNSDKGIHKEIKLQEGNSTGRFSEVKLGFQVTGTTFRQEEQTFKFSMQRFKMRTMNKKFKDNRSGHIYFDNTVPKSLCIQSKS